MYRTVLITDGTLSEKHIQAILEAGIDAIQLRLVEGSFYEKAKKMRLLTRRYGVLLFINERVDIALAVGADGVHLPAISLPPAHVKTLGPSLLVGVSVHSLADALKAEQAGASYIHFGPVFETSTKKKAQGLTVLSQVTAAVKIPVIAVGGITPLRAHNCKEAGAYGVAAITAFSYPEVVRETVQAFHTVFSHEKKKVRGLQVILNSQDLALSSLCIQGGASLIQFRHKGVYTKELLRKLKIVSAECEEKKVIFLINDRVDMALAVNASGVHLSELDLPISAARKMLGIQKTIGAAASSLRGALKAQEEGADYVGLGHIFPTKSHVRQGEPLGLKRLQFFKTKLSVPLFAMGGINAENASQVAACGVDGIAVISAIKDAINPLITTQTLASLWMK